MPSRPRGLRRPSAVIATVICLSATLAAHAQSAPGWTVMVGGGGVVAPDYQGSSGYRLSPWPFVEIDYDDRLSLSTIDGLHYSAIKWQDFSFGPTAQFRTARRESDSRLLHGLGRVSDALELGGFVEYNPKALDISFELRQDVIGGHKGAVAELDAHFQAKLFKDVGIEVGPNLEWVDGSYMCSYFGVSDKQAAKSGYRPYSPGPGLKDVGMFFGSELEFSRHWVMVAEATYSYLLGNAARSPLVRNGGNRNQIESGLFLAYRF